MTGAYSSSRKSAAPRALLAIGLAIGLTIGIVSPAGADKKSEAREQFESAVRMRTMLEGYLEKDRALPDYKQTVAAYHKVYLITPLAEEVTPSLIAEGELYQEMGRLFDPKYFESAADTYRFLLKEYPRSRYYSQALLSLARIQSENLGKPDAAAAAYKEYLKRFPQSEQAPEARAALEQIAAGSGASQPASPLPEIKGQRVEPKLADGKIADVTEIHAWNTPEAARVIVTLDDTIQYDSARISWPERIYFDLYKAQIGHDMPQPGLDVQGGLVKSARIAQNKQGVVRLVLTVDGAKDYSAVLLSKPYRLVIDIHGGAHATARNSAVPATSSAAPLNAGAEKSREYSPDERAATPTKAASAGSLSAASAEPAAKSAERPAKSAELKTNSTEPSTKTSAKTASGSPRTTGGDSAALISPSEPRPTSDGQHSLTRALGLKINRIVIDPGHGGHDTGTIGPQGLMEKDLCLDVALRLGSLIEKKLPGAEVIYTRKDDTFISLEERTAIANNAKADLFLSIHANSSHDPAARGVETYYLNFTASDDAMEVATRENANSQQSLHDLQDLIKKIARNEKIEESKELARDIQSRLSQRLQLVSNHERDRGVKKAPFVVLIGANMPSVLSEISFVSNPNDERLLRNGPQRQRIADGLYRGIAAYLDNLNSLSQNQQKLISANHVSDDKFGAESTAPAHRK